MATPTADSGTPDEPIVRPAPHRWLWYARGGGRPRRHRAWGVYDTTTETWWLRHVARTLVQMAIPIVAIVVLLPAPWGLRAAVCGAGRTTGSSGASVSGRGGVMVRVGSCSTAVTAP